MQANAHQSVEEDRKQFREVRDKFRAEIKEMVGRQIKYKKFRKPDFYKQNEAEAIELGLMSCDDANCFVAHCGTQLRHTYIAYAIFRGKRVIGGLEKNPFNATNRNPFYTRKVTDILSKFKIYIYDGDLVTHLQKESGHLQKELE